MKPEIPLSTCAAFVAFVIALAVLVIAGTDAAWKRNGFSPSQRRRKVIAMSVILFGWLLFLAIIAQLNILNNFQSLPPRLMIAFLPPLVVTIILMLSGSVSSLLKSIPVHWLILIQSFRIVMELFLLWLFLQKIIPQQMTFEGRNFDVLTGITALILGLLIRKKIISSPKFIIAWNVMGLLLLLNIVGIAILSAPFPFRMFMNEPANTVIAYFPFVWLPGFVVPIAYSMHLFSIRQCLIRLHSKSS